MRARNIKPGFFKSEGLALCSPAARLLFIGLWCMADRDGRLEDRPLRIKAELFPYDNSNVEKLLNELADKKDCDGTPSFIVRYGQQKKYIQILHFLSHQTPHFKEKESEIPDISTCLSLAQDKPEYSPEQAHLIPDTGYLIPDILIPSLPVPPYDYFSDFWEEYPRKEKKVLAQQSFDKLKMNDALMEKIMRSLAWFKKSDMWTKENGKFIPMAVTWINQKRWEDGI